MTCIPRIVIGLLFLVLMTNAMHATEEKQVTENTVAESIILEPPRSIDTVTQRVIALEEEVQRLKEEGTLTPLRRDRLQKEMQNIEEQLTRICRQASTFIGALDDKSFELSKRLTKVIKDRKETIKVAETDVALLRTATTHLRALKDEADLEARDYRKKVLRFGQSQWKLRMADTKLKLLRARQSCDILTVAFIENMIALEGLRQSVSTAEDDAIADPHSTTEELK